MGSSESTDEQQIVYVISGESLAAARRYVDGACLSIHSLRRYHPKAKVVCACDHQIYGAIHADSHPLRALIDKLVLCGDADGGPVHRSRHIKTSLRRRLKGPFVYLDADTLVCGVLDELFANEGDVGLTVDQFFPDAPGSFPTWLEPFYDRLSWVPSPRYFSSGVMHVSDTPAAAALFSAWHDLWKQTVKIGVVSDQPSLNRAICSTPHRLVEYPDAYNLFVGRASQQINASTRVIAFLASKTEMALSYEQLLAQFSTTQQVEMELLSTLTSIGTTYEKQVLAWPRRIWQRLAAGMRFRATQCGMHDPRGE